MKLIGFTLLLLAPILGFSQGGVLYNRTNYNITLPTNITGMRFGGQFITNIVGQDLTNRNGSVGLIDTLRTNVLPGALGTLSTWNGGGLLTNLAFPQATWFTNQNSTNTYTPPVGAKLIIAEIIAQGGGGGSGRRGAAGSLRTGGGGGAGGAYAWRQFMDLSSITSLVVVIPAISTGGPAVTTDDSNGTNGLTGTVTVIYANSINNTNVLVRAGSTTSRGSAGNSTGAGAGGTSTVGSFQGGVGGGSSATGGVGGQGILTTSGQGAGGGGAGGGITTADVPSAGGSGGVVYPYMFESLPAGGNPGLSGASINTGSPLITLNRLAGWPGGGGGGSQTNAAAGDGANGYGWGSGGGGGGASLNGYLSGKGGDGGPSVVRIIAY